MLHERVLSATPSSTASRASSPTPIPDHGLNLDGLLLPAMTTTQLTTVITSTVVAVLNQMEPSFLHPPPPVLAPADGLTSALTNRLVMASLTIPKLREDTYPQWSFALEFAIKNAGLWNYITGDILPPSTADTRAYEKWKDESGAVQTAIFNAQDIETSYLHLYGADSPKDAWDRIRRRYQVNGSASLGAIDMRLMNLRMPEEGDVLEHIDQFRKLRRQLDGTPFEVAEDRAIYRLLASLPPSYQGFVELQELLDVAYFDELCLKLETHYRGRLACAEGVVTTAVGLTTWSMPEDLRGVALYTGMKNPALATRAENTCRDCLLTGHRAGQTQCPQFMIRRELWGPHQAHDDGHQLSAERRE